jgi:hypothetical protein
MRSLAVFLFTAAVVLCSPCTTCRCSDRKQPAQATPSLSPDLTDLRVIRSLLGKSIEVSTTEHFCILHEATASYVPATGETLEKAHGQFYRTFSRAGFELARSADRLVWICFPQQSQFDEYAVRVEGTDLSWLDGYYSTLTNRVAIVEPSPRLWDPSEAEMREMSRNWVSVAANTQAREKVLPMSATEPPMDVARLTHELAHQLAFNSGLQKRGVMYPFWVSEGLATNFEFEGVADNHLESCSTARRDCLVKARLTDELLPLAQFVVQTSVPTIASQSRRYYAQAWAFFQYLLTERGESLRDYLRQEALLPPGRRDAHVLLREFVNAFGSLDDMETSWDAFLDRQERLACAAGDSSSPPASER